MYPTGMVAPRAHQRGRMKSAASPSTVNESQKILRSILWIVSRFRLLRSGREARRKTSVSYHEILVETGFAPSPLNAARDGPQARVSRGKSGFGLQFFHYTLNQLFGVGKVFHDDLHIHDRLARPALALAVDAMLPDEGHRVGDQVHGDSEASARHAHALFEVLQFFLLFVEDGHGQIVMGM